MVLFSKYAKLVSILVNMKSLAQKELEDFDRVFKALAHPTRRHILVVLRSRGDKMPAGDIVKAFEFKWPTVTRHLQLLEKAGLISVTKNGTQHLYEFRRENMNEVLNTWMKWFH